MLLHKQGNKGEAIQGTVPGQHCCASERDNGVSQRSIKQATGQGNMRRTNVMKVNVRQGNIRQVSIMHTGQHNASKHDTRQHATRQQKRQHVQGNMCKATSASQHETLQLT